MHDIVERIKARCVECGDCLVWQGASSRNKHPQIKVDGKVRYVRKVLWEAQNGPVPGRKQIAHTCGTRGCVIHCEPQTHGKIQKRVAATGVYSTPARGKKIAAIKRAAVGKLTEDQAREIRESDVPAKRLAEKFGICPSNASSIRRGERWKDYSNPFAALL